MALFNWTICALCLMILRIDVLIRPSRLLSLSIFSSAIKDYHSAFLRDSPSFLSIILISSMSCDWISGTFSRSSSVNSHSSANEVTPWRFNNHYSHTKFATLTTFLVTTLWPQEKMKPWKTPCFIDELSRYKRENMF